MIMLTRDIQGSYAPNTEQNPVYTKKCMVVLDFLPFLIWSVWPSADS